MNDGEYISAFDMSKLWNRFQKFDCDDQGVSCLVKLCNKIGEDRDSENMPIIKYLLHDLFIGFFISLIVLF